MSKPTDGPTPGPWGWFGDSKRGSFYLATKQGGRRFVLSARPFGPKRAQFKFNSAGELIDARDLAVHEVNPQATDWRDRSLYRHDILAIDHPDARLIAAAPDLLAELKNVWSEADAGLRQRVGQAIAQADPSWHPTPTTAAEGED